MKCSHQSDVTGACDPNYVDVLNCWEYSKYFAVKSYRVHDNDSLSQIVDFPKQYSNQTQIKAIILTGHSNNEGIRFGSHPSERISSKNVQIIAQQWKHIVTRDAVLLLNGCNTRLGQDNIADEFRSVLPQNPIYGTDQALWRYKVTYDEMSENTSFPFKIEFIDAQKKMASHR